MTDNGSIYWVCRLFAVYCDLSDGEIEADFASSASHVDLAHGLFSTLQAF